MTKKERNDLLVAVPDIGQAGWYFREFNGKRNFAPPAEESNWYRYVSVELDNAPDFMSGGDNVGVATAWAYPKLDLSVAKSPIGKEAALSAIAAGGPWRKDQRSKGEPWVGVPIAEALGLDLTDPRVRKEVAKLVTEWTQAGLLREVEGTRPQGEPAGLHQEGLKGKYLDKSLKSKVSPVVMMTGENGLPRSSPVINFLNGKCGISL